MIWGQNTDHHESFKYAIVFSQLVIVKVFYAQEGEDACWNQGFTYHLMNALQVILIVLKGPPKNGN